MKNENVCQIFKNEMQKKISWFFMNFEQLLSKSVLAIAINFGPRENDTYVPH